MTNEIWVAQATAHGMSLEESFDGMPRAQQMLSATGTYIIAQAFSSLEDSAGQCLFRGSPDCSLRERHYLPSIETGRPNPLLSLSYATGIMQPVQLLHPRLPPCLIPTLLSCSAARRWRQKSPAYFPAVLLGEGEDGEGLLLLPGLLGALPWLLDSLPWYP